MRHGAAQGLRMAVALGGHPHETPAALDGLRAAGLAQLVVRLDQASAAAHVAAGGRCGSWRTAVALVRRARAVALPVQVVTRADANDDGDARELGALARLLATLGPTLWSIEAAAPVAVPREASALAAASARLERTLHRVHDLAGTLSFDVETTAATPQYRRVTLQRQRLERRAGTRDAGPSPLVGGIGRARGVNDGDGVVHVRHDGAIQPSAALHVEAGNVRTHDLVDVYRTHPLFRALRGRAALGGKCGACEFRHVCGGSRARAWATSGDPLGGDPLCAYVPAGWGAQASA